MRVDYRRARACSVRGMADPQRSGKSRKGGDHGQRAGHPAGRRPRGVGARVPVAGGTPRRRRYYAEHGGFLGDSDFVWGPEGLREESAGLLGRGRRPRRPGDRLRRRPVQPLADRPRRPRGRQSTSPPASWQTARRLDARTGVSVPVVQADAQRLPFGARDLRRGLLGLRRRSRSSPTRPRSCGRWPGCCGRAAAGSSRRPTRSAGASATTPGRPGWWSSRRTSTGAPTSSRTTPAAATYVEHHRTIGDRVREIAAAGLHPRRRRRAGVAGGPRARLGAVEPAARPAVPGHGDLPHPSSLTSARGTVGCERRCASSRRTSSSLRPLPKLPHRSDPPPHPQLGPQQTGDHETQGRKEPDSDEGELDPAVPGVLDVSLALVLRVAA